VGRARRGELRQVHDERQSDEGGFSISGTFDAYPADCRLRVPRIVTVWSSRAGVCSAKGITMTDDDSIPDQPEASGIQNPTDAGEADGSQVCIADAYRLKHEINQSITYRGLSAREVKQLKDFSRDDWDKVRKCYDREKRESRLIPNWFIGGAMLLLLAAQGYLHRGQSVVLLDSWWDGALLVLNISLTATLIGRERHRDGYSDGYFDGLSAGVNKALRISGKEIFDAHERGIQMEIDEDIIDKMEMNEKRAREHHDAR